MAAEWDNQDMPEWDNQDMRRISGDLSFIRQGRGVTLSSCCSKQAVRMALAVVDNTSYMQCLMIDIF
jgi:hypothetical protein